MRKSFLNVSAPKHKHLAEKPNKTQSFDDSMDDGAAQKMCKKSGL